MTNTRRIPRPPALDVATLRITAIGKTIVLLVLLHVAAPAQSQSAAALNVLLIVSEDNGPQLGCYGDRFVRTPHLDRLAASGVRFANAFVTHAVCSSSRSSILTGLYPHQNGQIALATHQYAMFRAFDNIPSVLKGRGYRTGLIGKLHVNPESAFPFDFRWNESEYNSFNKRDVRKVAEVAGRFMSQDAAAPFFLMVNFPDAHFPLLRQQNGLPENPLDGGDVAPLDFIGADSPRLRQGTADYYNCMMRLDSGVGLVLDALERSGKAGDTLVIYLGDHGAQFSRGKATCFEGGLRIPMIARWPGRIERGTVAEQLVSTIDVLPTVVDALGAPAREDLPGRSLLALAGRPEQRPGTAWRRYLFAERTAYHSASFFPQRTVRDARFKLILNLTPQRRNPVPVSYETLAGAFFIYGTTPAEIAASPREVRSAYARWHRPPRVELYDLQADPHEFVDLSDSPEHAETKERLLAALAEWRIDTSDPLVDPAKLALLAEEHDYVARSFKSQRYPRSEKPPWKYLRYLSPEDGKPKAESGGEHGERHD